MKKGHLLQETPPLSLLANKDHVTGVCPSLLGGILEKLPPALGWKKNIFHRKGWVKMRNIQAIGFLVLFCCVTGKPQRIHRIVQLEGTPMII